MSAPFLLFGPPAAVTAKVRTVPATDYVGDQPTGPIRLDYNR